MVHIDEQLRSGDGSNEPVVKQRFAERIRFHPTAHLWIVGLLSLAWNAFGVLQFVMTQRRDRTYFASAAEGMDITPAELLAYADSFPAWVYLFSGAGVWGGLLGSLLLLLRSRFAALAFGLSLAGLAGTQAYRLSQPQPPWAEQATGLTLLIWGMAIALLLYALWMRGRGALR